MKSLLKLEKKQLKSEKNVRRLDLLQLEAQCFTSALLR